MSAFETYRHVYRDVITPYKVAELLILNHAMPRSLHACLDEINDILGDIANVHSVQATRQAGELHATLHATGAWTTSSRPACIRGWSASWRASTGWATASAISSFRLPPEQGRRRLAPDQ